MQTVTHNLPTEPAPAIRLGTYRTLEAWRGLACLAVVVYHMSLVNIEHYAWLQNLPFYRVAGFGYLGVYVFFVISGYCIANAACRLLGHKSGVRQYAVARARRILPTLWIALALTAVLTIAASRIVHLGPSKTADQDILHQSFLYFVANLTLTPIIFHQPFLLIVCWTLSYEAAFYLIVGIAMALNKQSVQEHRFLNTLHALTVSVLLGLTLWPHFIAFPLDLWPVFGFGVAVYDIVTHPGAKRPLVWLSSITVLTLAFVALRPVLVGFANSPCRVTFGFGLAFAWLALWLHPFDHALSEKYLLRAFAWVGLFSYSLYLISFPCLGAVGKVFGALHVSPGLHYAMLASGIAVTVIAGRVFYFFAERPFLKKARRHLLVLET